MSSLYKELASYEEKDAKIFKGRGSEIQEMYENFTNNEYLVCYADSGEGKSSIIEAGLIPVLRGNFFYPIRIVFKDIQFKDNNIDFNKYVCQAISDEVGKLKEDTSIRVDTIHPQRLSNDKSSEMAEWEKQLIDSYAWLRLRYARLTIDNFVFTPVLIFDQFEEVFTNPQTQEWTDKFFAWLQELTMDLCPKDIVDELESRLGTDRFPQIVTQKHFKAIFSLRSEYIGQLDYWGIQKHYIPQLKNNRYLLRPLTIAGAKEVITQQEGFTGLNDVAEDIVDILRNLQKGKNSVLSKESQLPCVPALFLSVICSQVYSLPKQEQTDFIQKLRKGGKEAIERLIDRFYKKAVSECQIPDKDLEVIEDLLVNSGGIRQRVSSQSDDLREIDFSKKYLKILKDARLIRVIPEYNKTEKSVELIHDCLCSVIKNRKEERSKIKEEEILKMKVRAEKLKGQREDAFSGIFLLVLFLFVVWLLSTVYQDKPTFMALLDLNSDNVVKFYNEKLLFNIILGNLAILPILIYSTVKKLRITSWLSVYGIISNLILLYLFNNGQDQEIGIRAVMSVVIIGVPVVTLIYSYLFRLVGIPSKEELNKVMCSVPITIFFLVLSTYLFFLCVFNDAIGLPEPSNSCWGIVVVPLLTFQLFRLIFDQGEKYSPLYLIILLLGMLGYNNKHDYPCLPNYACITLLIATFLITIWQFRELKPNKRIVISIVQLIVIVSAAVLNLGFNPVKVDYNSVSHVYNWREVQVKDDNGRLGIVFACNGDTLLPCAFDSISKDWFACMTRKVVSKSDTVDVRGLYKIKEGVATYKTAYYPSSQLYIYKIAQKEKIDTTLTDSIRVFAARTYFELRNLNIAYLQGDSMYTIDAVKYLPKLLDLQLTELDSTLMKLEKKIGNIGFELVVDFNQAFAKSFYLCLLTDRIIRKDSVNTFSICQDILPFYFEDSSNFELSISYSGDIDWGDGSGSRFYHSHTKVSEMRDDLKKLDAWYTIAVQQMIIDLSLNNQEHNARMNEKVEEMLYRILGKSMDISKRNKKVKSKLEKVDYAIKRDSLSNVKLSSVVKNLVGAYNETQDIRSEIGELTTDFAGRLDEIGAKKEMDMIFKKLIDKVYRVVGLIAEESPTHYKANFISICEYLYRVASVRKYEDTDNYLLILQSMFENMQRPLIKYSSTQKESEKKLGEIKKKAEELKMELSK